MAVCRFHKPSIDCWLFSLFLLIWYGITDVGLTTVHAGTTAAATYTVTFQATWNANTHPQDFPLGAHFSPLIGATHNANVTFWNPDGLASVGIESMAELGTTTDLRRIIDEAREDGTALAVLSGSGTSSPGGVNFSFEIQQSHPLVTLVTMIAPSPDWFVGIHGLSLFRDNQWVDRLVIDLLPYDAGTDSGVTFLSLNADTMPQEPIARLTDFPFLLGDTILPLGTFTFQREETCCMPGDVNGDGSITPADAQCILRHFLALSSCLQ